ncbi:MAG TPA: aquaporin [Galbitalea sp.]|jgi:aquaporin Z|nr:aquaporin [Galbitalea sp.]
MAETTPAPILSRLIAEAFGTLVLVGAVIGTAVFASSNTGYVGIALAAGLAVVIGVYAVGGISGGHFNPAVTLGVAAAGRLPWRDVLPYIAAQLVGGIVASSIMFGIAAGASKSFFRAAIKNGFASNGYGAHSPGGFDLASAIIIEFVLTAIFLYVILTVTAPGSTAAGFAGLAIGLTLSVIHLISIPVDGTSVNPARSIASAIYGADWARADLWVFIIVPAVGGLVAGYTWKYLFARSSAAAKAAAAK